MDANPGDGAGPSAAISLDMDADAGAILSLTTSPLALVPAFSPSTNDYYVRCTAGTNALTIDVGATGGSQTFAVQVVEDQAIVLEAQDADYWIRCLPHDFPVITVDKQGSGPTPGYFLANSATYAIVFDTNGTPVWYERGTAVDNVDSPAMDTISYMPNATSPFGTSESSRFVVDALDTSTTTSIVAVNGPTDAHELQSLPNGDHLLFTFPIEAGVDLAGLKTYGANESIADCEIQEVSPDGELVWSWLASEHVDPILESLEPATDVVADAGTVVDVFHCNSIDVDSSGNLLMSMRHANALFYIDRSTGQILWKLGGTSYNKDGATIISVQDDPEATFSMQHDARFQPGGTISLFDDHGAGVGVARAVEYSIDTTTNTATAVWQALGTAPSQYEGSCRRYADGETVIGWGYVKTDRRIFTEVDEDGEDVFDLSLSGLNPTYRAVKVPLTQLDIGTLRATTAW
jgi:hypothetical protein